MTVTFSSKAKQTKARKAEKIKANNCLYFPPLEKQKGSSGRL